MSVSLHTVHAKAKAMVDVLDKLPPDQLTKQSNVQLAQDYNTLHDLAIEASRGIDERFLGRLVKFRVGAYGKETCGATYAKIATYARKIVEQVALAMQISPAPPGRSKQEGCEGELPVKAYCVAEIRKKHPQAYARWTTADDGILQKQFFAGRNIHEMAEQLGRNRGSIHSRLRLLGLI